MSDPLSRILVALERRTGKIARKRGDGFLTLCPSHDDREPSLSVREGKEGKVLIHCFGGCSTHRILNALDLQPRDLFPR